MKLPASIAKKLISLQNGEKIPFSKLKHSTIESMIDNGILKKQIQGRSKSQIYLTDKSSLSAYLMNHFGIDNLVNYVTGFKEHGFRRANAIDVSSNSKLRSIRTFKGFLINCFQPLRCKINNKPIIIRPLDGTFTFVYDYETFIPSESITIVGIENPENFRFIHKQMRLFEDIKPLFVSRYPQNKDLIKWLQLIPNNYLHFGDFDFAGLNIYVNEYKKYLTERAQLFLPPDIDTLLSIKGNRDNYHNQTIMFDVTKIEEENVIKLLRLIERYKKGLEQEILSK